MRGPCRQGAGFPMAQGEAGLRVVRMLEAADESLKHRGKVVRV